MFISTRPADKVTNEVSIIIGYPFKPGSEASAESARPHLRCTPSRTAPGSRMPPKKPIWSKRCGRGDRVVKGVSAKGTQSTDTFALKGLSQALDRVGAGMQNRPIPLNGGRVGVSCSGGSGADPRRLVWLALLM